MVFQTLERSVVTIVHYHSDSILIHPLALVTDEGLPKGRTRDGPWDTNNWIESSFRTFNIVFLEHRKNKRHVSTMLVMYES